MKIIAAAILLFTTLHSTCQEMVMNDETTTITYSAKHLAARLEGTFRGADGKTSFDTQHLAQSYLKLKFASNTMTSNETFLTPNLAAKQCFNSAKYPNVELASTAITRVNDSTFNFKGTLKIKGITKPAMFRFFARANAGGYDFKLAFPIIRKQFGLTCTGMGKMLRIKVSTYAKRM